MPHRLVRGDAGHGPLPGGLDGLGDREHLLLDRGQPDHRVQLGHGVIDGDLRPGPRRAGRVVADGVFGVGQRGGPGRDAVTRRARMAAEAPLGAGGGGARGHGSGRGQAGPAGLGRAVPAVHPLVLDDLGQPPAQDGQGDEDGRDHPDGRLVRPQAEQDEAGRDRPEHGPGGAPARHVRAGQLLGRGDPGHHEREDQQRDRPGPVDVREDRDRQDPGSGSVSRGPAGPLLGHGDGRGQQGERKQERPQDERGGGQHDLQDQGRPAHPPHDPGRPARLVSRGGLGPVVWQHLASSSLVPASQPRRADLPAAGRQGRLARSARTRLPDSRMSLYSASPRIATAHTSILSVKNPHSGTGAGAGAAAASAPARRPAGAPPVHRRVPR